MDQEKGATQPEKKEENEGHGTSTSRTGGTTQNRQIDEGKRALGSQTDEGDQTDLNVAGDKPTHTSPDAKKSRDESIAHSNSTADHTNRSAYETKGGRLDSASGTISGSKEEPQGPSNAMNSREPDTAEK
jgi:hypothetical protein